MNDGVLRVGLIGTGRISDLHAIEYLANPRSKLVALCDRDAALAKKRATNWGVPDARVYDNYADLLRDPDVDMVEILLPHQLHLEVALAAVASGKAVSLQKPMCFSLEDADKIVAAAEGNPRRFKVFENFLFFPPVMKAKELVDAGAIGQPLTIRIKSNPGDDRSGWEIPQAADRWRQDRSLSGGGPLVFDDGHHHFAIAWLFMGCPSEVHAFIGETRAPNGFKFDAPAMVSMLFPENRMGNVEIVYSPEMAIATKYYAQDDRVEITGSKGVIWINCGHGQIGNPPPVVLYADGKITTFEDIETGWERSFVYSVRHYIEALATGGKPCLTAAQGREVLRFAIAAEESARQGKPVNF